MIEKLLAGKNGGVGLPSVPIKVPNVGHKGVAGDRAKWSSLPNDAITLDDFMAKFCEQRRRESRLHRKKALLAAARHGTVTLPPLAAPRKHGQANNYFVHDLLAAWQGFLDRGVDLPGLLPEYQAPVTTDR